MSQIPVLNLQHTHTQNADKAVSTEHVNSSTRCSKWYEVKRWARPAEAFQKCRSLNLCHLHTHMGASRWGTVHPILCKAHGWGLFPYPTLLLIHTSFRPSFFFPNRVHCHAQRFFSGVSSQGSQCFLLQRCRLTEWSLLSVLCVRGLGDGEGGVFCFLADFLKSLKRVSI